MRKDAFPLQFRRPVLGYRKSKLAKALEQYESHGFPCRTNRLDPADKFLYVCGEATNRIVAYRLDQETVGLTPTATNSVGKTPWGFRS